MASSSEPSEPSESRSGSKPSKKRTGRSRPDAAPRKRKRKGASAGGPAADDTPAAKPTGGQEATGAGHRPPPWARTPEERTRFYVGLAVTAVLAFAFYLHTTEPYIGLGDTALVIDEMAKLALNSHVNNHRIAVFFGHLFTMLPVGELAFRANLMSTVFGSITVVLTYVLAYRMIKRLLPTLLATFSIAVMHSLWWHSTIVENYAINAVMMLTVLLLLLRDEERTDSRLYYIACAVSGLAIVNHVQMGFLSVMVFVYAILQRKKSRRYGLIVRWFAMGGCYLIGLLPYVGILIRDMAKAPEPTKILYWAIGGDFTNRMFEFNLPQLSRDLLLHFLIQYPTPMLIFIVLGIDYVFDKKFFPKTNLALAVGFTINTLFFLQFHTWDQFAFLLPSFLIAGHFGIIGVRNALERARAGAPVLRKLALAGLALSVVIPPFLYRQLAVWGEEDGFWHDRYNNNYTRNTHDCAGYLANPDKGHWTDARDYVTALGGKLPWGALYVDDDARMFFPVQLYYQKYLQWRPDVRVIITNSWGFDNWGVAGGALANLVDRSIDRRDVFFVSVKHPHEDAIRELLKRGIVPERFDVDPERWIYRMRRLSRAEHDAMGRTLYVLDSFVGRNVMAHVPVIKRSYERDEALAVRLDFAQNEERIPIEFRWVDPTGSEYFRSEPFTIEPGNTQIFSHLDRQGDRTPGRWVVEVSSRGERRARVPFRIE